MSYCFNCLTELERAPKRKESSFDCWINLRSVILHYLGALKKKNSSPWCNRWGWEMWHCPQSLSRKGHSLRSQIPKEEFVQCRLCSHDPCHELNTPWDEPIYVKNYEVQESIPLGWEPIPGLLKKFTNTRTQCLTGTGSKPCGKAWFSFQCTWHVDFYGLIHQVQFTTCVEKILNLNRPRPENWQWGDICPNASALNGIHCDL